VAVAGAALVLLCGILEQREAFHVEEFGVDWNVIFLLIATMVIVNIIRPTGLFEHTAIRSAKLGRGEPFRILAIFAVVTAGLSAFFDNVTTVSLISPVTLLVADALEADPAPELISGALASNIGGTAIGASANVIVVGLAQRTGAEISFGRFLACELPIMLMTVFVSTICIWLGSYLLAI
jgi:Na+/H+ antiporter NhaD/arsenite permease-like protein